MKLPLRLFFVVIYLTLFFFNTIKASEVPILQPGAPGESSKEIDSDTAINIASSSYTKADVEFMQGMIIHHHQALVMSKLAPKNTNNKSILDLAKRIDVSQKDEIRFMQVKR